MAQVLKPKRSVYVQYQMALTATLLVSLLGVAYLVVGTLPKVVIPAIVWGIAAVVLVLVLLYRWVFLTRSFAKTEYHIHDDRIVVRGGGIFSQYEQELIAQNVTHVMLRKPFPEFGLFQTGHVYVQAAGGADVEVTMRSLDNPEETFGTILSWLETHGFQLDRDKPMMEAAPEQRGIVLQVIGGTVVGLGTTVFFLVSLFVEGAKRPIPFSWGWQAMILAVLLGAGAILSIIYFYGFLLKRRYQLYENVMVSELRHWMEETTIIPMQNLSDSVLTQGLVARALSLHDLQLSCQGSGHEITFRTIANGLRWKDKLDQLILKRTQQKVAAKQKAQRALPVWGQAASTRAIERDETSTADLVLNQRRLMLPPLVVVVVSVVLLVVGFVLMPTGKLSEGPRAELLFPWLFLGLGAAGTILGGLRLVYGYVYSSAFHFSIKASSVASSFQFVMQKKVEFQAEKITAVILKEGWLDRWFGTCAVEFWSIGASDHLRFGFIDKDDALIEMILNKVGIHPKPDAKQRVIGSNADPMRMMQAGGFFFGPLLLVSPLLAMWVHWAAGVGALVLVAFPMIASKVYYNFHQLTLFEDYLWFRKGVIHHTHHYVLYDDVKYVVSTTYPFSSAGKLTFEITGERVIKTDNGEYKMSNRFAVRFVPEVRFQHLILDLLLDGRTSWDKLPLTSTHPDSFHSRVLTQTGPQFLQAFVTHGFALLVMDILLGAAIVIASFQNKRIFPSVGYIPSVGLVVLLVVNVLAITYLIVYVRSIQYILDEQKVIRSSGVFFHKKLAIHYQDIDFIGKKYGVLNKMFGTGNITINTVGSSKTDLTLANLSDVESFYSMLKDNYQGGPVEDAA